MSEHKKLCEYPSLMEEWDYEKNILNPFDLTTGSGRKVWWKCRKGHSWEHSIVSRYKGSKCPYCMNRKVLYGFNDLETQFPNLIKQWDYEKNTVIPSEIVSGSMLKVWWKCEIGHSWMACIMDRSRSKNPRCPYCHGDRVEQGFNDLETVSPDLAKQWNHCLNEILPSQVTKWSAKKVWWVCEKGHSWKTAVSDRSSGKNCPYCNSNKLLPGFNDLESCSPVIAKEWDYEKNSIFPSQVFKATNTKMWWRCSQGHSWQAGVADRTLGGNGCPYCSGKKVLKGFNDLETVRPDVAKEWDYEKNSILPSEVVQYSGKTVWWKCEKGHSWERSISGRSSGNGCPYCSGKKVLKGYNDLETVRPDIVKEWDYEKNSILPSEVVQYSGKKVWWKCKEGHSWKVAIATRTNCGNGCPYCCNQKILTGYNDLLKLNPKVAKEWDYAKNELEPSQVAVSTNKSVWWKCEKGHSWKAPISTRTRGGTGCPYCKGIIPYVPRCVN